MYGITILEEISEDLAKLTNEQMEKMAPSDAVRGGEKEIGAIVDDHLKRLCTLMDITAEKAIACLEDARAAFFTESEDTESTIISALSVSTKHELLKDIFWYEVRRQFDIIDKPHVGIREGYKIVLVEEPILHPPPGLSIVGIVM